MEAELPETRNPAELLAALWSSPLWQNEVPAWVSGHWKPLKEHLLATNDGWEIWADWYENRLRGGLGGQALERAVAEIREADWENGAAHVNSIIKRIVEEHASAKFPQRRLARIDPAGPVIALRPQEVPDQELYDRLCDQVRETLALFPPSERTNLYSELGDVFALIDGALSDRGRNPITVHRRLAQSALEVVRLLTVRDYLGDDFKVRTLADDLHEALARIPDAVPAVAEEIARRMPLAIRALGAEDLAKLRSVLMQVVAVSTDEVAELANAGPASP